MYSSCSIDISIVHPYTLNASAQPQSGQRIWAPPSEFVSSSIPSWQILTAHAQPFREARDLAFCLKVPLDSLLVWASSEGSGETARMHSLAWTFAACTGDKYQIRLTRSISKSLVRLHWCLCFAYVINIGMIGLDSDSKMHSVPPLLLSVTYMVRYKDINFRIFVLMF